MLDNTQLTQIPVIVRPRPFQFEKILRRMPQGRSLEQMIAGCGLDPVLLSHCNTIICVNDQRVPRENWVNCVPIAGDVVTVNVVPAGGGGGGAKVARSVAMIAIMVVAMYTGLGMSTAAASALITASISIAGGMAVNALMPAPTAKSRGSAGGTQFGISGTQNQATPFEPVPRPFGRVKVYPRYAARPYTEAIGSDQYLRCLFTIGKGKFALSDFKIGETALSDFQGVEIQQFLSGDPGATNTLFPNDVYEEALTIELTEAAVWQTRSTQPDIDEIGLDFTFPGGVYQIYNRTNHGATTVVFEVQYAPYGTTDWVTYTSAIDLSFSGNPSSAINAGQSVVGLSSGAQGVVQNVVRQLTPVLVGPHLIGGGEGGYQEDVYEVLNWVSGIRVSPTSGSFQPGETIRMAGAYDAVVASVTSISAEVAGPIAELHRYGIKISVPRGQWTVRLRRLTADHDVEEYVDTSYWTALRSIAFESPVMLAGCTMLALRIKASNQLNGVVDQLNCISEAIIPAFDGTNWVEAKTRNPAWAFCEILRGNSNKRPVTLNSRFNLVALQTWAINNEMDGLHFDGMLDQKGIVWDALKQVCFTGFASPGMVDNKFTVVEDRPKATIVQHLSPRNSWDFSGKKIFARRPHALKCKFFNQDKDYTQDERIVYDDGYDASTATLFEDVELFGVTDSNHVWKAARRMIATARLRPETFQVSLDVENLVCTRGDKIRLTHDVIMVGLGQARVKSLTFDVEPIEESGSSFPYTLPITFGDEPQDAGFPYELPMTFGGVESPPAGTPSSVLAATFDSVFPMEAGRPYACRFRRSDGTSLVATIVTNPGNQTSVAFSPAIPIANAAGIGDLCLFGEVGEESIECLVMRVEPGSDLTARLTLVNYDVGVYSAESGAIPEFDSHITQPPVDNRLPAKPTILSMNYSAYASDVNADGTLDIGMTVVFDAATNAFNQVTPGAPDVIQGFQAQYRIVGTEKWISLPIMDASARQFSIIVRNNTTYEVRIRSYSLPGLYSDWATGIESVALTGTIPNNVTGLQVVGGGSSFLTADCQIEWEEVLTGVPVKDYKVEVRTSNGVTLLRTEYVTVPRYAYPLAANLSDGGPRAALMFLVWARSPWGDLSVTVASLSATNPAPGNPQGVGSDAIMGGVRFYWNANTEVDFAYFEYRIKVPAGGTFSGWERTTGVEVVRMLTSAEKISYGGDAAIHLEVRAVDQLAQTSGSSATNRAAGSVNIQETDIADFAVKASKIFTKIPVVEGLSLADNSPSAGYVAWSAHTIYYNGVAYAISAGNANTKYLYWKNAAGALQASDTHPSSVVDWIPGADFIIAVNIDGIGQEAWNAIANEVIGSAYIQRAGIVDANIQNISGTKILATTSIAIGMTPTFGADGIQLEYNGGNPRFYAGDGANNYVKFDGSALTVRGVIVAESGSDVNGPNLCPNAAFEAGLFGWGSAQYLIGCTPGYNYSVDWMLDVGPGGKGTTPYIYQDNRYGDPNGYFEYYSQKIPVKIGERYCVSAYLAAHRCPSVVYLVCYNSADATLATSALSSTAQNNSQESGGKTLAGYKRCYDFCTIPAGASYVRVLIRKYDTDVGQTNSYLFFLRAAAQAIGFNQTTPPPWAPCDTSIIVGGYIRTELLSATNIQAGTIDVNNLIVNGDITFGKLANGAASVTSQASGTTSAAASVVAVGGDKILIIAKATGFAGSTLWVSLGGEGFGYFRYDKTSITVNVYQGTSSGTLIASATIEGRACYVSPQTAVIDILAGDASGSKTYTVTTNGISCQIKIANLRR